VLGVPAESARFLRLPDGGLDARDLTQVGQLIQTLRTTRPRLLYLPHPHDGSFDHQEAFALCWRAAGMAGSGNFPEHGTRPWWVPSILGYEVWAPIRHPEYTEDITQVLDRKAVAQGGQRGGLWALLPQSFPRPIS
jgi:LmbE family N-acetylglucosaminyl deacetylase